MAVLSRNGAVDENAFGFTEDVQTAPTTDPVADPQAEPNAPPTAPADPDPKPAADPDPEPEDGETRAKREQATALAKAFKMTSRHSVAEVDSLRSELDGIPSEPVHSASPSDVDGAPQDEQGLEAGGQEDGPAKREPPEVARRPRPVQG